MTTVRFAPSCPEKPFELSREALSRKLSRLDVNLTCRLPAKKPCTLKTVLSFAVTG
ncbi:hypothethical protein (plasmid) [Ralstonia solanacearum PSI07]|nr:hypothethical protein [Ralstonia solanacearum PSI07]